MTFDNPHPLANPLTKHRYAFTKPAVTRTADSKSLTVPQPKPYDPQYDPKNLTVPNSDIPYHNGPVVQSGFIDNTSLFMLMDGSIVDFKTGKIVLDPNKKFKAAGYWNDPASKIAQYGAQWGKTESIESLMSHIGDDGRVEDPNMSPESIAYWKRAKAEAAKLEQNLTDEQKQLLDDLNSGKMFPLTKLVDED